MGITVTWDNTDKTALRYDFDGKWNWLDFDFACAEATKLLKTVEHPVAMVINLERSGTLAAGAVYEPRHLREPLPGNRAALVAAGEEAFARAVLAVLTRMYEDFDMDYTVVPTLTDARTLCAMQTRLV